MAIKDYFRNEPPTLSEEEFVESLIESKEALLEVEVYAEESYRLEDIANGLEDLSEVVAGIEQATLRDLVMVENAARISLAGTGVSTEQLFPSLENCEGATISLESLNKSVKKIWEAILKIAKKIWETIEQFFKSIFGATSRLQAKNARLRERIEAVSDKKLLARQTLLGKEISALIVDGRTPKSDRDIIAALDAVLQQGDVVYSYYAKTVAEAGERLAVAIERFDFDNPVKSLQRVIDEASRIDFSAVEKLAGGVTDSNDPRWDKGAARVGKPLPGNRSIFYIQPQIRGAGGTELGQAEAIRNRRISVSVTRSGKRKERIEGGTISTIPAASMLAIVQRNKEILDMVAEYRKAEVKMIRTRNWLNKACEKATKKLEGMKNISTTAATYHRAAVNFNAAFARWCMSPHVPFTDLALSAVRASMVACSKSIANHE